MDVVFERQERIERVVIDFHSKRVKVENDIHSAPFLELPLNDILRETIKKWLKSQVGIRNVF